MAIVDVGSRFTSILLDETSENVINVLLSNYDTVHRLIKKDLKKFLKFSCFKSFLIFKKEKNYCQLDGAAMGPPLGHRQSNFFVILKNQNSFFLVPQKIFVLIFTKRYVDYSFVSFNSHDQLKKFVEYMNTKDPYVRFTLGHKNNNLFSFLDVKICRENVFCV